MRVEKYLSKRNGLSKNIVLSSEALNKTKVKSCTDTVDDDKLRNVTILRIG